MQDQYNAVHGGLRWYNFGSKKVQINNINISKKRITAFEQSLFLFYTKKTRKSQKILKSLNESWQLKKQLSSNTSNYHIDSIYNYALNSGAEGGKLLGAGGGGFLLFFVKNENKKKFVKNMKNFELINFNFYNKGTTLIHN